MFFFAVFRRRNPLGIRHPRTVKYLFNFHILVGLIISSLGLWLCWWAPSTRARENPYWSGLIVSSISNLLYIEESSNRSFSEFLLEETRENVLKIVFLCSSTPPNFSLPHSVDVIWNSRPHCNRLQTNTTSKTSSAFHHIFTYQLYTCHDHSRLMYINRIIICMHPFDPYSVADNRMSARSYAGR